MQIRWTACRWFHSSTGTQGQVLICFQQPPGLSTVATIEARTSPQGGRLKMVWWGMVTPSADATLRISSWPAVAFQQPASQDFYVLRTKKGQQRERETWCFSQFFIPPLVPKMFHGTRLSPNTEASHTYWLGIDSLQGSVLGTEEGLMHHPYTVSKTVLSSRVATSPCGYGAHDIWLVQWSVIGM